MADSITVTAVDGPGLAITARLFSNVVDIDFQVARKILQITTIGGKIHEFDINAVTTVTYTISGGNATVAVS